MLFRSEAGLWLGVLPLAVYFATFLPAFFYDKDPMTVGRLLSWQQYMLQLQDSVKKPHTYMSRWWQWMANIRPIWFLYENVDGAQRGGALRRHLPSWTPVARQPHTSPKADHVGVERHDEPGRR